MRGITDSILPPLLKRSAARPLITHYDDDAGTRVELSVVTVANWAAKTANWLRDEADVEPGDAVAFCLPAHWQSLGILLGAWWVGADVVSAPDGSRVAFTTAGSSAEGSDLVAEVSLHPMGMGLSGPPSDGAVDFVDESRAYGDEFVVFDQLDTTAAALLGRSVAEVLTEARLRADALGIGDGTRVLSVRPWDVPSGIVDVVAVLVGGGSLVQCTGAIPASLDERIAVERTTVGLGTP